MPSRKKRELKCKEKRRGLGKEAGDLEPLIRGETSSLPGSKCSPPFCPRSMELTSMLPKGQIYLQFC